MTRRSTGPDKLTVEALYLRCEGLCEGCAMPLRGERGPFIDGHQVSHRRPRGAGGTRRSDTNDVSSLMLLNRDCHEWIESNRSWALRYGFLVPQSGVPATVPVWLYGVDAARQGLVPRLYLLSDDAAYLPVEDAQLPEVISQ